MKLKIGITGASGFIGKRLVKRLVSEKYDVIILSRKSVKDVIGVRTIVGSLSSKKALNHLVSSSDILIHLAAEQIGSDSSLFKVNVDGTKSLIDELFHSKVHQLIYLSTVAVYGESRKKLKETDICSPTTMYGLTKYLAEICCLYWGQQTKNAVCILRPFNVYGEESTKGVVYKMTQKIKKKKSIVIYGDGKQTRDFLYVDDLVEAIVLSLKKNADGIYNLGLGKNFSLLQLIKKMEKVFFQKISIIFKESEQGKSKDISFSSNKIRTQLNWKPRISIEKGLKYFLHG